MISLWQPITFEDELLQKYINQNPGELYLEVPVGITSGLSTARRIDGLLIPGKITTIYPPNELNIEKLKNKVKGKTIHLIEAKRDLNRTVIGQVLVAEKLLDKEYQPSKILKAVVCTNSNEDLEWFCKESDISVSLFSIKKSKSSFNNNKRENENNIEDVRTPPDMGRKRAFFKGWTDAINGKLYSTVHKKKTHANIGNLFGWIYGDQSKEFKEETWERYIQNSTFYDKS